MVVLVTGGNSWNLRLRLAVVGTQARKIRQFGAF